MVSKGFELSDDDEDQGQPTCPDSDCPDVLMLEPVQPPAPVVVYLPPFDFQECIRRLGGSTTVMFKALEQLDSHIPPGPIVVHSERAGGAVRSNKHFHCQHSILHICAFCDTIPPIWQAPGLDGTCLTILAFSL